MKFFLIIAILKTLYGAKQFKNNVQGNAKLVKIIPFCTVPKVSKYFDLRTLILL